MIVFIDFLLLIALIIFIVWILSVSGLFSMVPGLLYSLIVISIIILIVWILLRFFSHLFGMNSSPRHNRRIFGSNRV